MASSSIKCTSRFFHTALVLIFAFSIIAPASGSDELNPIQTKVFLISRVDGQRTIDDLYMLFPEHIKTTATCYQSALSNYIEDQGGRFESTGLEKTVAMVLDEEKFNPWDYKQGIYSIAKPAPPSPEVSKTIEDELQKYVGDCASKKPVPWSVAGSGISQFTTNEAINIAEHKIMTYNHLSVRLIGRELPDDKKPVAECLARWNYEKGSYRKCADFKCADTVPQDKKRDIINELEILDAGEDHCKVLQAKDTFLEPGAAAAAKRKGDDWQSVMQKLKSQQ